MSARNLVLSLPSHPGCWRALPQRTPREAGRAVITLLLASAVWPSPAPLSTAARRWTVKLWEGVLTTPPAGRGCHVTGPQGAAGSPGRGARELVPLRPPSLVCRGAVFPYPPWVPVCVGVLTTSPKDNSHSGPGPSHKQPHLIICKDPVSRCSHMPGCWALGPEHVHLGPARALTEHRWNPRVGCRPRSALAAGSVLCRVGGPWRAVFVPSSGLVLRTLTGEWHLPQAGACCCL